MPQFCFLTSISWLPLFLRSFFKDLYLIPTFTIQTKLILFIDLDAEFYSLNFFLCNLIRGLGIVVNIDECNAVGNNNMLVRYIDLF